MYHSDDTIAAIASAAGGAARGVLRISGPRTAEVLAIVFLPDRADALATTIAPSRIAGSLRASSQFRAELTIPADLYFWPGKRSYTREPLAELHTFGSPPLLSAALRSVCGAGARLAAPGEFTLRAFLAGRIDLTEAEAVLGVIDASGPNELATALAQLAGGLARPLGAVREQLLDLLAHIEAGLDFVEEDIEFISRGELEQQLAQIAGQLDDIARQMAVRGVAVDLPRVVLYGVPNVGKSSLFNALLGTAGALVSERAGTTRDYVTATLDLGGCRCELVDTAGVEEQVSAPPTCATGSDTPACATGSVSDRAERDADFKPFVASGTGIASGTQEQGGYEDIESLSAAAQRATQSQHAGSDVAILCLDAARPLNSWELRELAKNAPSRIVVFTKQDQALGALDSTTLGTSARTGFGLDELRDRLRRLLFETATIHAAAGGPASVTPATAQRAASSLATAEQALAGALEIVRLGAGEELVASELRHALDALGEVTGAVFSDDILDRVFSRFCIGK